MRKILIATGGTGGHLFPAQQLAEELDGCDVLFAGHNLEKTPFFNREKPYREIVSAGSLKKWPQLLKGLWQSLRLMRTFKPDVVVGFGSFHSFPLLLAAVLFRKKILLFEANCSLGKVSRFFAPFAKKIAFQFAVSHPKATYVPLLPWKSKPRSDKKYAKDRFTILVFGGSQGAAFINQTFCQAAKLLSFPFQVIHLTGKEDKEIQYDVPATVKPFEEEMQAAYEVADLIVCRCGAGTVAEILSWQKPAVMIPYPYAYDHQRKNGEYLKEGVRLLLQKETTPKRLAEEIEAMKKNLEAHREALKQIPMLPTKPLAEVVRDLLT